MKINIKCSQTISYNQEIEVTEEEYKLLKEYDGVDVSERNDQEAYMVILSRLDFRDVYDSDDEFTDVFISKVKETV